MGTLQALYIHENMRSSAHRAYCVEDTKTCVYIHENVTSSAHRAYCVEDTETCVYIHANERSSAHSLLCGRHGNMCLYSCKREELCAQPIVWKTRKTSVPFQGWSKISNPSLHLDRGYKRSLSRKEKKIYTPG